MFPRRPPVDRHSSASDFSLRFIFPPSVFYTNPYSRCFLAARVENTPWPRRHSISLFFSREQRESSRHLVSNAIFFTRETSNFPVLSLSFFFRPSRRNCRCSRVTAINFPQGRSATINRATARTSFSTARTSSILQAKLNLYYNEILSSPGKTGKTCFAAARKEDLYTRCAANVFSFISDLVDALLAERRILLLKQDKLDETITSSTSAEYGRAIK